MVQLVDSVVGSCPQPVQSQWAELRPFILDPGDPARLRAAADAWMPEGESGGSGSLFQHIDSWRNNVHDTTFELRRKWQDEASDALDSFINNKVDACFDALESRCEPVAIAIRAMADAQDALNQSIEDAENTSVVGAIAGAIAGGGATLMTAGMGSAVAVAMLSAVVTSFVTWTYEAWGIYKEFVAACLESLDKLGVTVESHGGSSGMWPRPWGAA
jgi:hypothetical protein